MIEPCPSCCDSCRRHHGPSQTLATSSTNPYSLAHHLPAGTITLKYTCFESICSHVHCEDGWHPFHGHAFASADKELCSQLDFLILHRFVAATCRVQEPGNILLVRLYIIPYDLPNVKGVLRRRSRDAVILERARRYMQALLPQIAQDKGTWDGISLVSSSKFARRFVDPDRVCYTQS